MVVSSPYKHVCEQIRKMGPERYKCRSVYNISPPSEHCTDSDFNTISGMAVPISGVIWLRTVAGSRDTSSTSDYASGVKCSSRVHCSTGAVMICGSRAAAEHDSRNFYRNLETALYPRSWLFFLLRFSFVYWKKTSALSKRKCLQIQKIIWFIMV